MKRLAEFLARHCRRLTLLLLALSVIPALFIPRLEIDNSIEVWLPRQSAEYQRYQEFTRRFGSEEFVILAMESADPLAAESLAQQQRLSDALARIAGVDEVMSLPQFSALVSRDAAKPELRDGGFLRQLLLSHDGKTAGMIVWLKPLVGPAARRQTIQAIENATKQAAATLGTIHLAGTPLMNVALDHASMRASRTFLPLAIAASILMLLLMLRSTWSMISVIIPVGLTVVWTMGLVAMSGRQLNMVTVTIPSLMFALALSNGMHLASEYVLSLARLGDRHEALCTTYRALILPAFLTAITTAIGFGSLAISSMQPVIEMGLFSGLGILIGFVCTLIVVPGLLSFVPASRTQMPRLHTEHWTQRTGPWMVRHRWVVIVLSCVTCAAFIAQAMKIRSESNVLSFFPEDSRVARDYAFVGKRLTGFYTAEIEIECARDQIPQTLGVLENLARTIEQRPEVARVDHLGRCETFGRTALLNGIKITPESIGRFTNLRNRFQRIEGERAWLRVSVFIHAMNSSEFYDLLESMKLAAKNNLPPEARFELTGIVPLLNDAQAALVRTQVYSFLVAALVILAVLGLLFRSWRVMLAVIPPNLLPIAGTLALMAGMGIPLDAATVMIASVVIGLAVDDAIHYLSRYRTAIMECDDLLEASRQAFSRMGRAAVFTSVVAATGFLILALAQFRPVAEFGLLTGFTMLTSLAGDLFVLPSCVALVRLWRKP